MALDIEVYRSQRLVLARFKRAASGDPDPELPDVDERGYDDPYRGPLVGITQGMSVRLRFERLKIDPAAPLFLTIANRKVVSLEDPEDGTLPSGEVHEIRLKGEDGGTDFRSTCIQVRYGERGGPILHLLNVWVFRPREVDITPHMVTISQQGGGASAVAPIADLNAIMEKVRAVWIHYGITFSVGRMRNDRVALAKAGIVSDTPYPGEIRTLLANNWPDGRPNWVPNTINAYFVNRIGTRHTLGYGFSRSSFAANGLPNPGILLADRTATSTRYGVMHWANDLAHEIGHFFTLWHPENRQPPQEREDTWSRRLLMHNFNQMRGNNPWPSSDSDGNPYSFRPRFDDAGYGQFRRGCFVSMKNLPQLTNDGECTIARNAINSAAGPY